MKKLNGYTLIGLNLFLLIIAGSCTKKSESSSIVESTLPLTGEKTIVCDLKEKATVFSTIDISSFYGSCSDLKFPVTASIVLPDNSTIETNKSFLMERPGNYQVELKSIIGDETIKKNFTILAEGYDSGYLFNLNGSRVISPLSKVDARMQTEYDEGIQLSLQQNSVISYKNVIDLNEVNGNLIEIVPNVGVDAVGLSDFKVTLTDCYDKSNKISVNYRMNYSAATPQAIYDNGTLSSSFIQVTFNGVSAGNTNYSPIPNYSIAWEQSFIPQFTQEESKLIPLSFSYDYETNCVYSKISGSKFLIMDLDDPTDAYPDFMGFKTGEVNLSIEGANTVGNLVVTKIGNTSLKDLNEEAFSNDNSNMLLGDLELDNLYDGIVGYKYDLPSENEKYQFKLFKKVNEEFVEDTNFDASNFVPSNSGDYCFECTSINLYGYKQSKKGYFKVLDIPKAIKENSPVNLSTKLFDIFTIPQLNYSGGIGKLTKEYFLVRDGVESTIFENEAVVFDKKNGINKLKVIVTDKMNYKKEFLYDIAIDNNVIDFKILNSYRDLTLSKDSTFVIPAYKAIDYSKDNCSENNIPVTIKRGIKEVSVGDTITITNDTVIHYLYDNNGETIDEKILIHAIDSKNTKEKDLIYNTENVKQKEENSVGLGFIANAGNMKFQMPYQISTTNLKISFSIFKTLSNFDNVKITLLSKNNEKLIFEFKELGNKPVLFINGEETPYQVSISTNVYNNADKSNWYGQTYYTYSFVFDGNKRKLFNQELIYLCDISKFDNKLPFNGFEDSSCLLFFECNNAKEYDIFILNEISNQGFSNIHLENGELIPPAISFTQKFDNQFAKIGDTVIIPKAYVYDVFDDNSTITLSIVSPNGDYLIKNSLPSGYELMVSDYGMYSIIYSISDSKDNFTKLRYSVIVFDDIAPIITVNGTYKDTYQENENIHIQSATVVDNSEDIEEAIIWLEKEDLTTTVLAANSDIKLTKGKYSIVYYTMDLDGNTAIKKFEFIVK